MTAFRGAAGSRSLGLEPPVFMAAELADADRLNGIAAKWAAKDWPARVAQVRQDREVAEDLRLVVEEFWRHGEGSELARRLEVAREGGEGA